MSGDIESIEHEMNNIFAVGDIDQETKSRIRSSIEQLEGEKDEQIAALESELNQIRNAHSHMIKAYEAKLSEFVIPVEELGFDPLVPNNKS